jgi:hypothetical protein
MSVGSSGAGPRRESWQALLNAALRQWDVFVNRKMEETMLWTVFVILAVLWLLGIVTAYTMGGFIHVLLVIALVALILQLMGGRRIA